MQRGFRNSRLLSESQLKARLQTQSHLLRLLETTLTPPTSASKTSEMMVTSSCCSTRYLSRMTLRLVQLGGKGDLFHAKEELVHVKEDLVHAKEVLAHAREVLAHAREGQVQIVSTKIHDETVVNEINRKEAACSFHLLA